MAMTLAQKTDMYRFFAIAFDAAPGVVYMDQLDTAIAGGMTTKQIVNVYTTKSVFTAMYPNFLDNTQFATKLVDNVVGASATAAAKLEAVADIVGALAIAGTTRGDVIYTVFNNLANKPFTDATWGGTAKQLANQVAVAQYYTETLLANSTDTATLQSVIAAVTNTSDVSTPAAISALIGAAGGQTFTLTTDVDTIVGTIGNDLFVGQLGGTATLTALDYIDGAGGNNSFDIYDLGDAGSPLLGNALPAGLTVKNVQVMNLSAAGSAGASAAPFDTTGITGLTNLNVLQSSGNDYVTVGNGTAVSVIDTKAAASVSVTATDSAVSVAAAGKVTVAGGSTQTVTTKGGVALSGATGAITVTDTAQAAANSTIDDGTSVTVTTAYTATTTAANQVTIGGTTKPTGAVSLVEAITGTKAAATAGGDVIVKGGTTVTVAQTATQAVNTAPAAGATNTNYGVTQAAVTVTGSTATTAVTVNQSAAKATVNTTTAKAGATTSDSIAFGTMAATDTITVAGLTFTANGTVTAAQAAAAFAGLAAGAIQGASTLGSYSGTFTGFSTGAATTTSTTGSVVATSSSANAVIADIVPTKTGTAVLPVATAVTVGAAATAAVAGVGGIAGGAVTINDVNALSTTKAGVITSATLDGYGTAAVASNSLATLSLANSTGKAVTVNNDKTSGLGATSLALTVNKLGAASTLNLDATTAAYKTLAVTTATADSVLAVTAAAVTALTVAGTNAIDLTSSVFTALKTATISGAAGVTIGDVSGLASLTDVNASATSGAVTVGGLKATQTTYEGGSGVDKVTLTSTTITKAISLGAGNDTLTLASGTTTAGAAVSGGDGTDTLVMAAADAVTASLTGTFATKVTAFEVLSLGASGAAQTVHVDTLGNYNSVTTGGATSGALTLDGFTSGGTLTLSSSAAGGSYFVSSTAWATPTTDTFNIALKGVTVDAGSVTAAKVESISIAATDSTADVVAGATLDSLTLVAADAATFTVTGNTTLTLTGSSSNVKLALVDASGMTGGLVYTAVGTLAQTVKGGATSNTLTAHATSTLADTLIGGAGADTFNANGGLDILTGNGGNDTFVITTSANLNSYATITDANVGDTIKLTALGVDTFQAAKVTLGGTAVFQDYANAAVNAGGDAHSNGYIAWFQYGSDTYVVESLHNAVTTHDFQNGVDQVVKLTGLVDLTHTSLNTTVAALLIG